MSRRAAGIRWLDHLMKHDANRALILFDIDGTLLDMKGAGRRSFIRALKRVFGIDDDIAYISFAGATDLDVFRRIAERLEISPTPEQTRAFFEALPEELNRTVREETPVCFPGVKILLETLTAMEDRALLGIVTGNIEPCARIKLRHFDLHHHFVLGAFGCEHADRNELARRAFARARERAPGIAFDPVSLIGDTPSDVEAARILGATAIAVATGRCGRDELIKAGADAVLDDLSDLPRVLALLGLDEE